MSADSGPPRVQRVAAYNLCIDAASRLLMCRLSDITERPGSWTLPGGGIDFGEHPEAGALRELTEETGLVGRIVELLAVDSILRTLAGVERGRFDLADNDRDAKDTAEYHAIRIVYRTEITGGALRHETDESTDQAAWCTREDVATMPLVELGRLGVELAFGTPTENRSPKDPKDPRDPRDR